MWFWRWLLRFPWTARRSNQSILKEINSEFSLEGLILKLKLQYFGHLMWRANSLEKPWCWERLRAGGEGGNRGWNGWMASLTQWTWIWVWANSGREWRIGKPGVLQSMGSQRVVYNLANKPDWAFVFVCSGYKSFAGYVICKYFLLVCSLSFHSLNSTFHRETF